MEKNDPPDHSFRMIAITAKRPHKIIECFEGVATIKVRTLIAIGVASFLGSLAAAYAPNL